MIFGPIERWIAAFRAPLRIKLQFGFFLVIAVLILTGVVSLLAIAEIREHASQLDRLDGSVRSALGVDHSVVLQEHLSSMFLLTAEETYSTKLEAEQQKFPALLSQLRLSGGTSAELAAIEHAFARYEHAADTVRGLKRAGHEREAANLHVAQEHTIAHEIEALTKAVVARLKVLQEAKRRDMLIAQRWTIGAVAAFVALAAALALMLGSILARSILRPVQDMGIALERIAAGDFVVLDEAINRDELGSLVNNLNRTSQQLAELYAKERQTAQALEQQLATLDHTQAQLQQAQKMEAIGQLAGGVAHDFNNLLTVIGGRSSLLLDKMRPDDPARKHVELIERTGQRAAGLTRQLLAFSRKQILELKPLDLNILVAGVTPMLRRLIGEHVEVVVVPGHDVGHVMADAGQLEQVVMNLVVNARDAMSEGGMVKIETAGHAVPEPRLHSQGQVPPGQYVTLTVQDTGSGIDSVTLARIFEPFFTTKEPGKGTGLGLSTVHGIVHQSGGYIAVDSTLGRGTTFTVYLPRIAEPVAVTNARKDARQDLMRGTETVLLVEDDEEVRRLGSEVLQSCGYTVVETGDPLEALTIGERRNGTIDLLVTDMVLPAMGGAELATRLETLSPGLRVLCMSGYADKIAVVAAHEPRRAFLLKPFTPYDLARKVREALT